MRRRFVWLTALSGLLACSDSTEAVDQAFVTITSASPVVLRGDQLELTARLWTRTSPGDSVEVRNAELIWSTDDPTLATLTPKDNNTTIATGVNSGTVQIRALATGFEGAASASYALRVSDPLEIDSIRPATVRYGEKVTMYGVGVNNLFFAALEGAPLLPDTFTLAAGAGGIGHMSFWVPPPASSGYPVALSPEQIVVSPDSLTVLPRDLYEPNDQAPSAIDLGMGPFPTLPQVRFYNPALFFENRIRADSLGVDWYRFNGVTAGSDLTFIFLAPTFKNAHLTFLAPTVSSADSVATPGWTIGSGLYYCKDHEFKVQEQPADSLVVALRNVPAGSMDLVSLFFVSGRYGIAVVDGYHTTNPAIGPDRWEENDNCEFADRNFAVPATRVDLTSPFSDSLTIDNPHDVDWIRFSVPGTVAQAVTFKTAPPSAGETAAAADIDLHVMAIPVAGSPTDVRGSSRNEGSSETLTLFLEPGEYYMVVTDFAGVPTRYSLCAALGTGCTQPSGFVRAAARAQPRARSERGIR
ncbi:MAG TPA: hypothetical protein VHH32_01205 [Gemmatimonadales bacterium]|nr:hypothetical protein [Gemmatimonadales bacterium]